MVFFFVHPQEGWIGASPDGIVVDPMYDSSNGILKVKCPYTMRNVTPNECCQDKNFYCYINEDGVFRLQRVHQYYHQVQVQLFVCSDLYHWCDFCLYTMKGVMAERMFTDFNWVDKYIPLLN